MGSRRAAEARRAAAGGDLSWSGVSRRASGAEGDALREPEVKRRTDAWLPSRSPNLTRIRWA